MAREPDDQGFAIVTAGDGLAGELFAPETVRCPFPLYDRLREDTPLRVDHGDGAYWVVMRHADVLRVLNDPRRFSSDMSESENEVLSRTPIIFRDPPEHSWHRSLVNKVFTPRRVAQQEGWIRAAADELLDRATWPGDVVAGYCDPLPVIVIARMLGVTDATPADLKSWSDDRTFLIGRAGAGAESAALEARVRAAEEGNARLLELFRTMARDRRKSPRDDLVNDLAHAEADGRRLSEDDLAGICALLLTAGNVTTTNLLGNLLHTLATQPDRYRDLLADPGAIPAHVEESLRLDSPVQWLFRTTTEDVELGGARIPRGQRVFVYFGAANRDPGVFGEPGGYRPDRTGATHIAFGHGIHFCVGAPLARVEGRITLEAFTRRFAALAPAEPPPVRITEGSTHRGFASLHLDAVPRTSGART